MDGSRPVPALIAMTRADREHALDRFAYEPESTVKRAATPGDNPLDLFRPERSSADTSEVTVFDVGSARPYSEGSEPRFPMHMAPAIPSEASVFTLRAVVIGLVAVAAVTSLAIGSRTPARTTTPTHSTGQPSSILPPSITVLNQEPVPTDSVEDEQPSRPRAATMALRSPGDLAAPLATLGSLFPPAEPIPTAGIPFPTRTAEPLVSNSQMPVLPELEPSVPAAASFPAGSSDAPAPLPTDVSETDAIQTVLARYRSAFSLLDADAAMAIWPTVNARALGRAFERLEAQDFQFETCDIEIEDLRAVASCRGTARYVPKIGGRNSQVEPRQWTFDFRKVDREWFIEAVDAR